MITDAVRLASVVYRNLTQVGFTVEVKGSWETAIGKLKEKEFEAVILDDDLDLGNAKTKISKVYQYESKIKVVLVIAPSAEENKITAESSGADECMMKPFSPGELRRRLLKYAGKRGPTAILSVGDLVLHSLKRRVVRKNKEVILSEKEFEVLEYLMLRKDQIVSREEILDFVWDYFFESVSNLIDMFVAHLRTKIEVDGRKKIIFTYPKKGYMISEEKSLFD